jgi:hypothetical protein
MNFKVGDAVRATFSISGRITRFKTLRGIRQAVLDTGEMYSREIEESSLTLVTHCERTSGCTNPPDSLTRGGVWSCRSCWKPQ